MYRRVAGLFASWRIKTRSSPRTGINGADQNGGFVDTRTPSGEMPPNRTRTRRLARRATEVGFDLAAWITGLLVTGAAIRDITGDTVTVMTAARVLPATCVLAAGCGILAGLYRGRHQRGSFDEVLAISIAAFGTGLALVVLTAVLLPGQREPIRTVAGGTVLAMLGMLGGRYVLLAARHRARAGAPGPSAVRVIVFGAGAAGCLLVHSLIRQPGADYIPVALLDDDPAKRRLRVCGVPVLGDRTRLSEAAAQTGATVLVIAIARPSGPAIRELTAEAEKHGLVPKVIPSVSELLSGSARIEGVRDPRITDLLGRSPVQTDIAAVASQFAGKRILVTGAGGSIGSELCRQLHRFAPARLIMLDRDESALHAIQLDLHGRALLDSEDTVLADIRDPRRVSQVFAHHEPQIVFHAAALKHLPLLERYPGEALKTNVWGTLNVLRAAAACGAEAFVNISTDKAADPVSVLGYSKRVAERLTAHMAAGAGGTYLSVRFGNVLGSRGSVLTALTAQVAAGGPVTVTHPEVTRYFMTADEAVQLVLQAAVIGRDGEVLVLDMGDQVRIIDIARRLVAAVPKQVEIVFTGLRPGEKLTEDLLGHGECDNRPFHPLIRHVPVRPLPPEAVTSLDPGQGPGQVRADLSFCASIAARGSAGKKESATAAIAPPSSDYLAEPDSHPVTGHSAHVGHPRPDPAADDAAREPAAVERAAEPAGLAGDPAAETADAVPAQGSPVLSRLPGGSVPG
jgi:FlaA1/EpsC-like NDP-sugar epimerase